uniref:Uncharacterized protein n=1 Tax=Amphilophus citrinellus TaxID=61819 RepID=A0A3Q0R590_AMPCI
IPIWSMTCCQLWEEPCFFKPATSCSLILMMRLAIPWTSSSLEMSNQKNRSSGVLRIVAAILAPFIGGCDSTLFASSASLHTMVKPPTRSPSPMFLAKDWDSRMLWPCSMKWRTAQASRSMSPLAKP